MAAGYRPAAFPALRYEVAVPRFGVGEAAAARQHLADEGFVVFRDVLAPAEVDSALRLLWADLASLGTGIARGDSSTWHGDRWPDGDGGVGLIRLGASASAASAVERQRCQAVA